MHLTKFYKNIGIFREKNVFLNLEIKSAVNKLVGETNSL